MAAPSPAAARAPIALAGGDGASTLISHLAAEHSHGRGLLGFFSHEGARFSLARVCRELHRAVARFRWPVVVLKGHADEVWGVCELAGGRVASVSPRDGTLRAWSALTGVCERAVRLPPRDIVHCICALADGRVVTASVGVAHSGDFLPDPTYETMYKAADVALYAAKDGGRDRAVRASNST